MPDAPNGSESMNQDELLARLNGIEWNDFESG